MRILAQVISACSCESNLNWSAHGPVVAVGTPDLVGRCRRSHHDLALVHEERALWAGNGEACRGHKE